ncbi:DUF6343 family protein [Streptomyces sp. SBT349]|uniref:DUF6343 family protein n=1 Tax=Streptomyces sp. SBT349 TaxID=1580539 RepID=UPI00066A8B36|nr:DUF6343 family protein [Streptomyces sp. SBT349]
MVNGRHRRTGTEPVTAYSALRLRLVLNGIFLPLFAALTVALAIWWGSTDSDGSPSPAVLGWLTLAAAVLTVIAAMDLAIVLRRRRAEERGEDQGWGEGGQGPA